MVDLLSVGFGAFPGVQYLYEYLGVPFAVCCFL